MFTIENMSDAFQYTGIPRRIASITEYFVEKSRNMTEYNSILCLDDTNVHFGTLRD